MKIQEYKNNSQKIKFTNTNTENTNYSKVILTIPNLISTLRIIIIVIAAQQLYLNTISNNINAFILYVAAMVTDFFDGYFARKLNQISELGKILDPIADKLMVGSAVLILFMQNRMPLWFVLVVISRDILILLGGIYVRSKIHFVLPSIWIGKAAAVSLMVTFGLNILDIFFIDYLYYISVGFCVASLIAYALNAKQKLQIIHKNNYL